MFKQTRRHLSQALRELRGLQDKEVQSRVKFFREKVETLSNTQPQEIYKVSQEPTEAQKLRAETTAHEIFQLSANELRAFFYVLEDKKKKTFNYRPQEKVVYKERELRDQGFWPTVHPVNLHFQQETGDQSIMGVHGFPKAFTEKLVTGEMFNSIQDNLQAEAAPQEAVQEETQEKTSFNLVLKGYASDAKVKVIKEIKDILGLGLKEAKEKVEGVSKEPIMLARAVSKDTHQEMHDKLKQLGAEVEFE